MGAIMMHAKSAREGKIIGAADRISIRQRSGVWRVSVNGEFYGDYTRRYWAIEAAFEKADAIAAQGARATIAIAMDGQQDALLYDTGQARRRAAA
ncbi:MAG TPA: hypothetical protein PLS69_00185 [Terricaulis sp.]|nr:hypothetical protein [Terricaulis sp.]